MPRRIQPLAVVVFGLVYFGLVGTYTARHQPPAPCLGDRHALKGEARLGSDGNILYFDGQCWSAEPLPPRDMRLMPSRILNLPARPAK